MPQVNRIIFVGFLLVVLALALMRYSAPRDPNAPGRRLIPMRAGQAEQTPGATPEVPTFTVEIEPIPPGMTARGTSFPLGNGLWLTARHVANEGCKQIILVVNGKNVPAQIKFLDPNADLAVLQTPPLAMPSLPIAAAGVAEDQDGFAFGFPSGSLGATEGRMIGRAHMKLGGRLDGTAPVVSWAELRRFPDSLESLSGISGGPMLDGDGNVVGIIVSASAMRGRNYTVAPEILHQVQHDLGIRSGRSSGTPAHDAVAPPVELDRSAAALSKDARIAKTYCIPP